MSLHYLLDGYNLLKQLTAFNNLPLEEGRRAFLKWIDMNRPQGSVHNQVTVVFDGHPDHFGAAQQGDIRVIFSDGCSADDQIKRMADEDNDIKNCVVVSDDKDVFLYARSLGAKVMSVAAFMGKGVKGNSKGSSPSTPDGKQISLSRQEKINKELEKIWLKEK